MTLAAVCEIVLERDARLTTKENFNAYYDNPLVRFKVQLKEVCSDPIWGHAALYGYRMIQERSKDKHDLLHQCILKVQQKHRIPLLSARGANDLMIRDFTAATSSLILATGKVSNSVCAWACRCGGSCGGTCSGILWRPGLVHHSEVLAAGQNLSVCHRCPGYGQRFVVATR